MAVIDVEVPDIGDFDDVPVIESSWRRATRSPTEDPLVTLESDKATMDVPVAVRAASSQELQVKVGDKVVRGHAAADARAPTATAPPRRRRPSAGRSGRAPTARGRREARRRRPRPTAARRRPSRARGARAAPPATAAGAGGERRRLRQPVGRAASRASSASTSRAVKGSGRKGRITQGRRRGAPSKGAGRAPRRPPRAAGDGAGLDLAPWPKVDFEKFGEVERVPLSRIQKISGAEPRAQLGDDPARHPLRRGRHHRARGVPQAARTRSTPRRA